MQNPFKTEFVKTNQHKIKSSYRWLETVIFFTDDLARQYGGYCMGFYHCQACGAYEGFCFKLPDMDSPQLVSAEAHNSRNQFWRKHAHGDGRILLMERDIV